MAFSQVSCGERLSIDKVEHLYGEFETALSQGGDIELNAENIAFCDSAGLQLVVALQQALAKTDHRIRWHKPPTVLIETTKLLGLYEQLNIAGDSTGENLPQ